MPSASREEARAQKDRALELFARFGDVVGVGITRLDDGYAIKVNLRDQPPEDIDLPCEVNGVPVRVEIVGSIRKR